MQLAEDAPCGTALALEELFMHKSIIFRIGVRLPMGTAVPLIHHIGQTLSDIIPIPIFLVCLVLSVLSCA